MSGQTSKSARLINLRGLKNVYYDLRNRIKSKYEKPSGGIPASDLASGVIPDISDKQDKINVSGILKGTGNGGVTAAVEGTDYINGDLIAVQDTTPTDPNTQIWLPETQPQSVQVASYAELTALSNAISELYPDATSADIGKALIVKTVADGKPETFELGEAGGGLPDTIPTEETAQELLEYETYNTGLTDTALAVIGQLFTNLPQDETLTDILHSLELECERLDLIYNGWIAERESA